MIVAHPDAVSALDDRRADFKVTLEIRQAVNDRTRVACFECIGRHG